ncbi:MAG: iron chaperone [Acidimicrobiia bacterium]
MPGNPIDDYLATLDEPKRGTLEAVRRTIRTMLPDAEEALSYGLPAFKVKGKTVAGFGAAKKHLTYMPFSGTVLDSVDPAVIDGYEVSKGALRFPIDTPLPERVIRPLVQARLTEIGG